MHHPLSWTITAKTDNRYLDHLTATLAQIDTDGLMKRERLIEGPQSARVTIGGRKMLNLCANNYLGLADDPRLIAAAKAALSRRPARSFMTDILWRRGAGLVRDVVWSLGYPRDGRDQTVS